MLLKQLCILCLAFFITVAAISSDRQIVSEQAIAENNVWHAAKLNEEADDDRG